MVSYLDWIVSVIVDDYSFFCLGGSSDNMLLNLSDVIFPLVC